MNSSSQPVDKVEFHSAGDRLLGGGIGQASQALFFSLAHGLVTMKGTGLGTQAVPQQHRWAITHCHQVRILFMKLFQEFFMGYSWATMAASKEC